MGSGPARVIGRYALHAEIASGGMASVHFGRLLGTSGFARTVAIKRLHPQYAKESDFVAMFLDEARLAARIRHPNVVPTLDVVASDGELFLVMELVHGESMSRLFRAARDAGEAIPVPVLSGMLVGLLTGLHAAHEATDERGHPLGIVHRDVSPHNALVGVDGVTRVLDFGIAKAVSSVHTTREGQLKGKLPYMTPEQLNRDTLGRATDVYAAGAVLWEGLTGRRVFDADTEAGLITQILLGAREPPSKRAPSVAAELDAVVMRALAYDPKERFATAREMARALERAAPSAAALDIGEWVERVAAATLAERAAIVADIERDSATGPKTAARLAAAQKVGREDETVPARPALAHAPSADAYAETLPSPSAAASTSTQMAGIAAAPARRANASRARALVVLALVLALGASVTLAARRSHLSTRAADVRGAAPGEPLAPTREATSPAPSDDPNAASAALAPAASPDDPGVPSAAPPRAGPTAAPAASPSPAEAPSRRRAGGASGPTRASPRPHASVSASADAEHVIDTRK